MLNVLKHECVRNLFLGVTTQLVLLSATPAFAQDLVEFVNGSKVSGKVTAIRSARKEIEFETKIGTRALTRTYAFSKIHAVTVDGKKSILTPKGATSGSAATGVSRTESEVRSLIAAAGETPPDWFEKTKLNYPRTLDLDWPLKPPTKGWHSQKNMGQYIWSVINENPSRWHSGIKLVHHCISLHQDNPTLLERDMKALGNMYFNLLQDYARAAFWLEKANPSVGRRDGIQLAECYFRLGNKKMAMDMVVGKTLSMNAIKLYGAMGETNRAVRLAELFKNYSSNYQAFLLAGDALRQAGDLDEAVEYYQRVVDCDNFRNKDYEKRLKGRAQDSIAAIRLYDKADVTKVADGSYSGNSIGYNGRLDVEVQVAAGKVRQVRVTAHREKQYYAALTDTPDQILERQSVQGIDATSGATITSQAIVNATARALAKGAK